MVAGAVLICLRLLWFEDEHFRGRPAADGKPLKFFARPRVNDDDTSAHIAVIATDVQPMVLGVEREGLVSVALGDGPHCDYRPFLIAR
jgi:hypothetical protein